MAKSKKRKRILVFSLIGVVLLGLTAVAILKKREVTITVQTEKVARRGFHLSREYAVDRYACIDVC